MKKLRYVYMSFLKWLIIFLLQSTAAEPVQYPEVWTDIQAKVLVWGLNDKDQLGGLKGSKVKVPTYSEGLSALRPIHIAGGSKSLFIVSFDGKVMFYFYLIYLSSNFFW